MTPDRVPGRISEATGATLQQLASQVPDDEIIVEIGAYKGKSTCYLATGSAQGNSARIISIDTWGTPGSLAGPRRVGPIYHAPGNQASALNSLKACGVDHLVTQVKGFSTEVALPAEPIGLLWVDGAHDYDSVKADFDRFVPLLSATGRLAVDDYGTGKCPGVNQAVDELVWSTSAALGEAAFSAWSLRPPLAVGYRG